MVQHGSNQRLVATVIIIKQIFKKGVHRFLFKYSCQTLSERFCCCLSNCYAPGLLGVTTLIQIAIVQISFHCKEHFCKHLAEFDEF
jgi:hypothetical protein